MLTIRSDTRNPTARPIISLKEDPYPLGIIYDIISGEFKRIKSIPYTNFELALAFIKDKDLDITTQISEKELNDLIQEALKILYGIN